MRLELTTISPGETDSISFSYSGKKLIQVDQTGRYEQHLPPEEALVLVIQSIAIAAAHGWKVI